MLNIASLPMAPCNWVPKWYRADGKWSAAEVADALLGVVARSIAANTDAFPIDAPKASSGASPPQAPKVTTELPKEIHCPAEAGARAPTDSVDLKVEET